MASAPRSEHIPPRPIALPVRVSGIPHELRQRDQWVTWAYRWDGTKYDKPPLRARRDAHASSTDPKTWATFAAANSRAGRPDRDGIGYVVSKDDPYTIIDIDDCHNPETGEIIPDAQAIVQEVGGYWEVSPSGTGLRGIVRATLPGPGRNRARTWANGTAGRVELYSQEKYLTITGHVLQDVAAIPDAQAAVEALYTSLEPAPPTANGTGRDDTPATASPPLTDAQVIAKASDAKNRAKFLRLWSGDRTGYQSDSEADLALLDLLR